jgi:hypothetical protein
MVVGMEERWRGKDGGWMKMRIRMKRGRRGK